MSNHSQVLSAIPPMQITSFSIYRYKIPLTEPLQLPMRTLYRREGLLLRLASNSGDVGWGEASPLPGFSKERLQEATRQTFKLKRVLTGRSLEGEWESVEELLTSQIESKELVPSVSFGLELALWHLAAEKQETTMPALLCPTSRPVVSICALLYGEVDDVIEAAQQVREKGYRAAKVKLGHRALDEDIKLVNAVSDILGESIELRLDANQAWDMEQALAFAEGTADARYAFLEEPLFRPKKLPDLVAATDMPIALDESLAGLPVEELKEHRYARAVVLKPTVIGGVMHTLEMAREARQLGMQTVISSAYEAGVGITGLVALSACIGDHDVPAGLGTYQRLETDIVRPRLKLADAQVDVESLMTTKRTLNGHMLREV